MRSKYSKLLTATALLPLLAACGSEDSPSPNTGGTATASGGASTGGSTVGGASGGSKATGGSTSGGSATGGGPSGSGGQATTGGQGASGGGGAATGGSAGKGGGGVGGASGGGTSMTGGAPGGGSSGEAGGPAGGSSGGGGTPSGGSGSGKLTGVENPGADCTVPALPSEGSLTANPKLPDPFKKMDGTAMTSKAEWVCRREEILRQAEEFIYGEKPRTPASAVSGSVTESRITVSVTDGGGSGMFNATVTLPSSGQAPYPALVTYGSVAAQLRNEMTSRGVAIIAYPDMSVASESRSGAFYNVYNNHPAGILMGQAWGVSRMIDVIEKNPGIIDPTKIAVTGCSRWGKGAFVAGVFDARIALTIPVESGVGGTPALRLISVLDTYNGREWPYHAISYVPWYSPQKLGQFTNANNDAGDNTDRLPVDMHEMMALVAPRGLYIVDNPSTNYNGLNRNAAYATAGVGEKIFEALGVPDSFTYVGASGGHCQWRDAYTGPLVGNIEKFLLGDTTAETGQFESDLGGNKPSPEAHMDFTIPTLSGEL